MKFLKPFYLLLFIISIISCNKEVPEIELNLSYLTLTISNSEFTTAEIRYSGNFSGDNPQILYKEKNSTDAYQSITSDNNYFLLSGLNKATEYEVKFEVSNNSTNLQSDSYYFTTKAVNFNYEKFYSENGGDFTNSFETFSHLNKQHVIHAQGLSDYNDVKVFLVNEQKTDSLEILSTVVSDSLTFTIPENYLSQIPRESVKKAWVGIKIKDSYKYLLNNYGWVNTASNPNYSPEDDTNEAYLKLKIFNDKPFIESILSMKTDTSSNCPNYTYISFKGDFLGYWDYYYWTPNRAELVIFDSANNLYNTYTYDYENYSNECDNFGVLISGNKILQDGLLKYHQKNVSQVKISNLPLGNYSAKIVFTFKNNTKSVETNTFNFIKE